MKSSTLILMGLTILSAQTTWANYKIGQGTANINYRSSCAPDDSRVLGAIEGAKSIATDNAYVACAANAEQLSAWQTTEFICEPLASGNQVTVKAIFECAAPKEQFFAEAFGGSEEMAKQAVWPQVREKCGEDVTHVKAIRVSEWDIYSHNGSYHAAAKFECHP